MLGAIIGDIIGSVYEWHNIKTTDFPLFQRRCRPTDDSVMTIAVAAFLPVMAERFGISEVYGIRLTENAASGRVLEKCGFRNIYTPAFPFQSGKVFLFGQDFRTVFCCMIRLPAK